jgi:hypothetical protein
MKKQALVHTLQEKETLGTGYTSQWKSCVTIDTCVPLPPPHPLPTQVRPILTIINMQWVSASKY